QEASVEQVRRYVEQLGYPSAGTPMLDAQRTGAPNSRYAGPIVSAAKANVVLGVDVMNGQAHLWTAGCKNHATTIGQELLGLFHFIARVAPGSYGLLYTLDDEQPAHNNAFRVYVLARGALTEQADPFLSPFVPVVEDPYSER